jgi:carbon storage regulator
MLVLTRKANEQIIIGDNVRVVVLGVQGNRVRLGLTAPDDVRIQRAEVEFAIEDDQTVDRLKRPRRRKLSLI